MAHLKLERRAKIALNLFETGGSSSATKLNLTRFGVNIEKFQNQRAIQRWIENDAPSRLKFMLEGRSLEGRETSLGRSGDHTGWKVGDESRAP
jgi:hypothetical protein